MRDVSEASCEQLGTLQVLLPDELHKAAHEDAVQVCLWVLLPVPFHLLQLFCSMHALCSALWLLLPSSGHRCSVKPTHYLHDIFAVCRPEIEKFQCVTDTLAAEPTVAKG